jgi:hypothetical protein
LKFEGGVLSTQRISCVMPNRTHAVTRAMAQTSTRACADTNPIGTTPRLPTASERIIAPISVWKTGVGIFRLIPHSAPLSFSFARSHRQDPGPYLALPSLPIFLKRINRILASPFEPPGSVGARACQNPSVGADFGWN